MAHTKCVLSVYHSNKKRFSMNIRVALYSRFLTDITLKRLTLTLEQKTNYIINKFLQ